MFINSIKLKRELEELKQENNNIKINANTLLVSLLNDIDRIKEKNQLLKQKNINLKDEIKVFKEENEQLLLNLQNLQENKIKIPKYIQNVIKELYLKSDIIYDCPICFDEIINDNLIITDCGHFYCSNCFIKLDKCLTCNYNFILKL